MKEGLDAEPIRLPFSETPGKPEPAPRTPAGIRRDFQEALADLRTDLNRFTELEARGLMACGYQMATKAFERQLAHIPELAVQAEPAQWPFAPQLRVITTPGALSDERQELLEQLRRGSIVPS